MYLYNIYVTTSTTPCVAILTYIISKIYFMKTFNIQRFIWKIYIPIYTAGVWTFENIGSRVLSFPRHAGQTYWRGKAFL